MLYWKYLIQVVIDVKLAFSFPVFFHVAVLDNTPRSRYKAVHYLICGFDPDEKDNEAVSEFTVANGIVTGYINGSRPISEILTSRYLRLSREEQIDHIRKVGLQQPRLAANALVQLFKSGMIDMDPDDIQRYLELSNTESTEEFLSDMLTLAIKHRVKQPLSPSVRAMLKAIREGLTANAETASVEVPTETIPQDTEEDTPESEPPEDAQRQETESPYSFADASFASYAFRELEYDRDRPEYRSSMIRIDGDVLETALSEDEIRQSTDLFRRADRTFFVDFTGTPAGLADVLLHRVSPQQCLQLVIISSMNSRKDFSKLRHMLAEIVRFSLADDGKMFFANSYDPRLPSGVYNIRVIYSIRQVSEDEKLRLDLAMYPPKSGSLTPSRKYRDRVPDFLLPHSFDPGQVKDQDNDHQMR